MKNCILQKKTFLFLHVHKLDIVLGVNTDEKNHVGKVCFVFWEPVKVRNFGNFVINKNCKGNRISEFFLFVDHP